MFDFMAAPVPRRQRARNAELGQFFTPAPIADFMADMFPDIAADQPICLLDAGAGAGALTLACARRWGGGGPISAFAWEVDEVVRPALESSLAPLKPKIACDFLQDAAEMILLEHGPRFTHAILNPPYRKIATSSRERRCAAAVGLETVNLYSAFTGLALELMKPGGHLVAIIPRSFCNGPYYRPFRRWILARAAIRRLHLFHSRRDAFAGDKVLQENLIIHLERGGRQADVLLSTSTGSDFADLEMRSLPFDAVVRPHDVEAFIHIPLDENEPAVMETGATLEQLGLAVATGPVVAFRLRAQLRQVAGNGMAPLLWPHHLKSTGMVWPIDGKRPNAIAIDSQSRKWLMPRGWYVLVKRFSSKEERRRIVACAVDPDQFPGSMLGIENKLNIIHQQRGPLPELVARGLAVVLNSTGIDQAFRQFSGHTQVNATDLRRLCFPSSEILQEIGGIARSCPPVVQADFDRLAAIVEPSGQIDAVAAE